MSAPRVLPTKARLNRGSAFGAQWGPRVRRPHALCARCASGDHRGLHRQIGCLRTVAPPPGDYICACPLTFDDAWAVSRAGESARLPVDEEARS